MEKLELIRLVAEGVGFVALSVLANKTFRFKGILVKIIEAAKDAKITEEEFQGIVDEVKKEIYH